MNSRIQSKEFGLLDFPTSSTVQQISCSNSQQMLLTLYTKPN